MSSPSNTWRINGDSVTFTPGMPVAVRDGRLYRAVSSSQGLAHVDGIVLVATQPTLLTPVAQFGATTLTADQWDTVTGEVGGLTQSTIYYLGSTLGTITKTPTTTPGQSVVEVGRAANSTVLILKDRQPILL